MSNIVDKLLKIKKENTQIFTPTLQSSYTDIGDVNKPEADSVEKRYEDLNKKVKLNIFGDKSNLEEVGFQNQTNTEAWINGSIQNSLNFVAGVLADVGSEDVGNIFNVAVGNTEKNYSNKILDFSNEILKKASEEYPIYESETSVDDTVFSSKYWSSQLAQLGYSTGIITSTLAKQALLAAVSKGSNVVLGTGKVANKIQKALKVANNPFVFGSYQGVKESYLNSLEAGVQSYEKFKNIGYSEELAKEKANEAATLNFRLEALPLMILNSVQFAALGKSTPFKKGKTDLGFSGVVSSIADKKINTIKNKAVKKIADYSVTASSEALEEVIQAGINKESIYQTEKKLGLIQEKTYAERFLDDTSLFDSAIGGALGGTTFRFLGKRFQKITGDKENKKALAYDKAISNASFNMKENIGMLEKAYNENQPEEVVNEIKNKIQKDSLNNYITLDLINQDEKGFDTYVSNLQEIQEAIDSEDIEKLKSLNISTPENITYFKNNTERLINEAIDVKQNIIEAYNKTDDIELAVDMTNSLSVIKNVNNSITEYGNAIGLSPSTSSQLLDIVEKVYSTNENDKNSFIQKLSILEEDKQVLKYLFNIKNDFLKNRVYDVLIKHKENVKKLENPKELEKIKNTRKTLSIQKAQTKEELNNLKKEDLTEDQTELIIKKEDELTLSELFPDMEIKTPEVEKVVNTKPKKVSSEEVEDLDIIWEDFENVGDLFSSKEKTAREENTAFKFLDFVKTKLKKEDVSLEDTLLVYIEEKGYERAKEIFPKFVALIGRIGVDVSNKKQLENKYFNIVDQFDEVLDSVEFDLQEEQNAITKKENPNFEEKQKTTLNKDNRTTHIGLKMANLFVDHTRVSDTEYLQEDVLNNYKDNILVPNAYILDEEFVSTIEKESIENPGSLTLQSVYDVNDEKDNLNIILKTNNKEKEFEYNFPVYVESLDENFILKINLAPKEPLSFKDFLNTVRNNFKNEDIVNEFKKMYSPMVYVHNNTPIAVQHDFYWYTREANNLSSSLPENAYDEGMNNVRSLRSRVYENGGILPVQIVAHNFGSLHYLSNKKTDYVNNLTPETEIGRIATNDIGEKGVLIGNKFVSYRDIKGELNNPNYNTNRIVQLIPIKQKNTTKYFANILFDDNSLIESYPIELQNSLKNFFIYTAYKFSKNENTKKLLEEKYGITSFLFVELDSKFSSIVENDVFLFKYLSGIINNNHKNSTIQVGTKESFEESILPVKFIEGKTQFNVREANIFEDLENLFNNAIPRLKVNFKDILVNKSVTEKGEKSFQDLNYFTIDSNFKIVTQKYTDVLKKMYKTNVVSHKITTSNGNEKYIYDIQPQIHITVDEEHVNAKNVSKLTRDVEKKVKVQEKKEEVSKQIDKVDSVLEEIKNLKNVVEEEVYLKLLEDYKNLLETQEENIDLYSLKENTEKQPFQSLNSRLETDFELDKSSDTNNIDNIDIKHQQHVEDYLFHNFISKISLEKEDFNKLFKNAENNVKTLEDYTISEIEKSTESKRILYEIILKTGNTEHLKKAEEDYVIFKNIEENKTVIINNLNKRLEKLFNLELSETEQESWAKNYYEHSILDSLDARVKSLFYGIPKKVLNTDNTVKLLGKEVYHSPDLIFNKIVDVASSIDSNLNLFKHKLLELKNKYKDSIYIDILNKVLKSPEDVLNRLLHKMITDKVVMYKTLISQSYPIIKDGVHLNTSNGTPMYKNTDITILDENSNKKLTEYIKQTKESFIEKFGILKENKKVLNIVFVEDKIEKLKNLTEKNSPNEIKYFFDTIGLQNVSLNTWSYLLKHKPYLLFNDNTGLKYFLLKDKGTTLNTIKSANKSLEESNIYSDLNNVLKTLFTIEIELNNSITGKSVRIADKIVQSTMPTILASDINKNLTNPFDDSYLNQHFKIPLTEDNYILNGLVADEVIKTMFTDLKRPSLETIKENNKKIFGDVGFDKILDREMLINKFALYTANLPNIKNKYFTKFSQIGFKLAHIVLPTFADKGTGIYATVPVIDFNSNQLTVKNNKISLSKDVLDFILEQTFFSEFKNILKNYLIESNVKDQNSVNKIFYLLSDFNTIDLKGVNIHNYLKTKFKSFSQKDKENILNDLNLNKIFSSEILESIKQQAETILTNYLNEEIVSYIDIKSKENVTGTLITNELYDIENDYVSGISTENLKLFKGVNNAERLQNFIASYIVNNYLAKNSLFSVYFSEASFYSKAKYDKIVKDASNVYEWRNLISKYVTPVIQKRAAMLIAPGLKQANSAEQYIKHIALNDTIKISENIINIIKQTYSDVFLNTENTKLVELEKDLKSLNKENYRTKQKEIENKYAHVFPEIIEYFKINNTDAQMYTTWRSHLKYLQGIGVLNKKEVEKISNILIKDSLTTEDKKYLSDTVSFQTTKLTYTNKVYAEKLKTFVPVYMKTSVTVLTPQLTKGFEIDKMRLKLEELEEFENLELKTQIYASYESANKIGQIETDLDFNTFYDKDISGYARTLPLSGFRLQQETPSKEDKYLKNNQNAVITMSSQMHNILTANGIKDIKESVFPNTFSNNFLESLEVDVKDSYTGEEIEEIYNKIYKGFSDLHKKSLIKELNLKKNFETYTVEEQKELLEKIQKILKKEIESRDLPDYLKETIEIILNEDFSSFKTPVLFDSNRYKFEALLLSIISARTIVHKLPGNSHILTSNEGFSVGDFDNVNLSDVIWAKEPVTKLQSTTYADGTLQYSQILIKPHFTIENSNGVLEHIDLFSSKYAETVTEDGKTYLKLKENIDESLLKMFSFRIPTSSHQSGAIFEIAGFLPNHVKDTIVVPSEHIVQIGEDFDIDKRYFYKSNFIVDSEGKIQKYNANALYKKEKLQSLYSSLSNLNTFWKELYWTQTFDNNDLYALNNLIGSTAEDKLLQAIMNYDNETIEKEIEEITNSIDSNKKLKEKVKQEQKEIIEEIKNLKNANLESISINLKNDIRDKEKLKYYENGLIDSYVSVFSAPNKVVQNKISKPLSVKNVKNTIKYLEDKRKKSSTFGSLLSDRQQQILLKNGSNAKTGVGVYSNAIIFQARLEALKESSKIELLKYVKVKEGYEVVPLNLTIGGFNISNVLGKNLKTLDGKQDIATSLAENQNIALDEINEQIMGKRNENSYTMPVYSLLAYLGLNLTKDKVKTDNGDVVFLHLPTLFMSQPIIVKYVEELEKLNKNILTNYTEDKKKVAEKITVEYFKTPFSTTYSEMADNTGQTLYNSVGKLPSELSEGEKNMQIGILEQFLTLSKYADSLLALDRNTILKTSSKLGISYFESIEKINYLNKLVEEDLLNIERTGISNNFTKMIGEYSVEYREGYEKIGNYYWNAETLNGVSLINSLELSTSLMPVLFPYESNFISSLLDSVILNKKETDENTLLWKYEIMTEFVNAVLSDLKIYEGSKNNEIDRIFKNNEKNKSLPDILNYLKNHSSNIFDNYFLQNLNISKNKNGETSLSFINGILNDLEKAKIYDSFYDLYNDNNPVKIGAENYTVNGEILTPKKIAVDLVSYTFLANFQSESMSLKNYIPIDYLEKTGSNAELRRLFNRIKNNENLEKLLDNFIIQYFQNNPHKAKVVENIKDELSAIAPAKYVVTRSGFNYDLYKYDGEKYIKYPTLKAAAYLQYDLKSSHIAPVSEVKKPSIRENVDSTQLLKMDNSIIIIKTLEQLKNTLLKSKITDEKFKKLITEFGKYIGNETKLVWSSSLKTGKYSIEEDTIFLSDKIFSNRYAPGKSQKQIINESVEIMVEEMLHAVTASKMKSYLETDNSLKENAPIFATALYNIYEEAKSILPYNPETQENYYSKNIYEFIAGILVSEDYEKTYKKALIEKNPSLFERFKNALKSLFNYLWLNDSEKIAEEYKNEIKKSIIQLVSKDSNESNKTTSGEILESMFQNSAREFINSGIFDDYSVLNFKEEILTKFKKLC